MLFLTEILRKFVDIRFGVENQFLDTCEPPLGPEKGGRLKDGLGFIKVKFRLVIDESNRPLFTGRQV
jgi:hypothetical protein